jgi:hypothetical protein
MGGGLQQVAFTPQDSAMPNYGSGGSGGGGASGGGSNTFKVPSTHEGLTAKESAVINMISKRESSIGDEGYDMILGDQGRPGTSFLGVPPKPITQMTLTELYDWQTQMLRNPKNAEVYGKASSAVGKGQFVRTTLFGRKDEYGNHIPGLLEQMGITQEVWGQTKFDKNLQDRLILQNFSDYVGDPNADPSTWSMRGLGNQWEAFQNKSLTQEDLNNLRSATDIPNSNASNPNADVTSKSASTDMELNKPPPKSTSAPAVSSPSVVNISTSAPGVDEPWAAMDAMFDRLHDSTLMHNPWI